MSENKQAQSQGGEYNEKKDYQPPPPPPPCPDPCDEPRPKWGPPEIRDGCCSHRPCCPDDKHCCTWDEVEDPCVRAASADCGQKWTKMECKCESSQKDCVGDEWDCSCYPQGTCVPCAPCQGLIPDPEEPTGGCNDPGGGECSSENLSKELAALNQSLASQQGAKTKLEADIKARTERANALKELIKSFDDIVKKYKEQRYKLICKEDCLKGFYRDVSAIFAKYPQSYSEELKKTINDQLCHDELAKCCQKNLEEKLTKVTKLIWERDEKEKDMKKAEQAFAIIKDLPKWIEDRFKDLETLSEEIGKALNDPDPEKQKWAFYLFYWKFAPGLCKCFPFPFCCEEDGGYGQGQKDNKPLPHLGCKPGDWHPRAITDDQLKALICCAWDYARKRKKDFQDATDKVADVNNNLDFIKKSVEADAKTLADRIKSGLEKVIKPVPAKPDKSST